MEKLKIKITEESLRKAELIDSQIEHSSMHLHYHFIWDLISDMDMDIVTYLEIGSYGGGSASLASSHFKKTRCFSVDFGCGEYINHTIPNVEKFKNPDSTYHLIVGNSHSIEIIQETKEKIGGSIDILFIDGDHSFNGALNDFINYSPILSPGGYVIFDDYLDWRYSPEVKHAVDHIVNDIIGDSYEIIGTPDDEFKARVSYSLPGGKNNCFVIRKK
jgi:predicted O-methyltransferase YrrM